jgi:NTP pyrophosphatase (non-canonical NTP hydrolase)
MTEIFKDVELEMLRQDTKWGKQDHNAVEWVAILTEELGEVAKEAVDFHFGNGDINVYLKAGKSLQEKRIDNYRMELVQVAAVAMQAIQSLDRQTKK